jgi:hypothetical protein
MNECEYCSWWPAYKSGAWCKSCGKEFVDPKGTFYRTFGDISGTYADTKGKYTGIDLGLDPDAIHNWFSLSYASYLVMPRAIMQHMSPEWQNRFVELLNEFTDAVDFDDNYAVNLRDEKGKFKKDPLSQYRKFPKERVPWRK